MIRYPSHHSRYKIISTLLINQITTNKICQLLLPIDNQHGDQPWSLKPGPELWKMLLRDKADLLCAKNDDVGVVVVRAAKSQGL